MKQKPLTSISSTATEPRLVFHGLRRFSTNKPGMRYVAGKDQVSQVSPLRHGPRRDTDGRRVETRHRRRASSLSEDAGTTQFHSAGRQLRPAVVGGVRQAGAELRRLLPGVGDRVSHRAVPCPPRQSLFLPRGRLHPARRTAPQKLRTQSR